MVATDSNAIWAMELQSMKDCLLWTGAQTAMSRASADSHGRTNAETAGPGNVRVVPVSPTCTVLSNDTWSLTLEHSDPGLWSSFCSEFHDRLVDVLATEILYSPTFDLIWIEKLDGDDAYGLLRIDGATRFTRNGVFIFCRVPNGRIGWLIHRRDTEPISHFARTAWTFLFDDGNNGVGTRLPILRSQPSTPRQKTLVVRLGKGVRWPLALPFDHWVAFANSKLGRYASLHNYTSVDWVVSGRPVLETMQVRQMLNSRLEDRVQFLNDSAFVVNHNYFPPWQPTVRPQIDAAVDLLHEIVDAFDDDRATSVRDGSINIFFNPTAVDVATILRVPRFRMLFANFHTEEGLWQACPALGCLEPVSLAPFVADRSLSHIELLSAAHCHSVSDSLDDSSTTSICQALLAAGVQRTAGSVGIEYALDYFARLLHLFCDARGLGPELFRCCLTAGRDFDNLMDRADCFLAEGRFPALNRDVTLS